MSNVNKIKKGETEYDIQDARINPTAEDNGKALVVNEEGGLEFEKVGGGGTKLYKHILTKTDYSTIGGNTLELITNIQDIDNLSSENFILGYSKHGGPNGQGAFVNGVLSSFTVQNAQQRLYNFGVIKSDGGVVLSTTYSLSDYSHSVIEL